jgi:hypothetical protein
MYIYGCAECHHAYVSAVGEPLFPACPKCDGTMIMWEISDDPYLFLPSWLHPVASQAIAERQAQHDHA